MSLQVHVVFYRYSLATSFIIFRDTYYIRFSLSQILTHFSRCLNRNLDEIIILYRKDILRKQSIYNTNIGITEGMPLTIHTLCSTFDLGFKSPSPCMCIGQNSFSVMLANKRSVGVTPELNLKNSLHIKDETNRQGIHPGLETKNKLQEKFKA